MERWNQGGEPLEPFKSMGEKLTFLGWLPVKGKDWEGRRKYSEWLMEKMILCRREEEGENYTIVLL